MAWYSCDWCGRTITGPRVLTFRNDIPAWLHMGCYGRWVEAMRALGCTLPGQKPWRPRGRR